MISFCRSLTQILAPLILVLSAAAHAGELPLVDAHIHDSHDAWDIVPPEEADGFLRAAGLKQALVSSSSDERLRESGRRLPGRPQHGLGDAVGAPARAGSATSPAGITDTSECPAWIVLDNGR